MMSEIMTLTKPIAAANLAAVSVAFAADKHDHAYDRVAVHGGVSADVTDIELKLVPNRGLI